MTSIDPAIGHVPTTDIAERRRPFMDRLIETIASGLGNTVGWLADSGVLFAVFAVVWIAIAVGLVRSAGTVDEAWRTIAGLPLLVQALVWVLFLPVMLGLWVWESSWPIVVRLVLVIGIGGWNLLVFLPRTVRATA